MEQNGNISVIILARNSAGIIGKKVREISSWVREIIVVDNGSTDATVKNAYEAGARVISTHERDFAALRMCGASEARGPWLLYLDTDEEIPDVLRSELIKIVASFRLDTDPHAYFLKRTNYYLGKQWPGTDGMVRFIYKPSLVKWQGKVHETAVINGRVGQLRHACYHYTHTSLTEMTDKTIDWSGIEAELRVNAQHPPVAPWRVFRVMLTGFWDSFISKQGYLVKTAGLIEGMYQAFSLGITYLRLWEKQRGYE